MLYKETVSLKCYEIFWDLTRVICLYGNVKVELNKTKD